MPAAADRGNVSPEGHRRQNLHGRVLPLASGAFPLRATRTLRSLPPVAQRLRRGESSSVTPMPKRPVSNPQLRTSRT